LWVVKEPSGEEKGQRGKKRDKQRKDWVTSVRNGLEKGDGAWAESRIVDKKFGEVAGKRALKCCKGIRLKGVGWLGCAGLD